NLNGGNDRLTYKLEGGAASYQTKDITVDLGSGNDVATFNFADNGSGGTAQLNGRFPNDRRSISVQGGIGSDQVDAVFGGIDGTVPLHGNRGYGDDRVSAELKGSVQSYASLNIDMEDMNDLVLRDPLRPWITLATILPGGNDDFQVTADAGAVINRFADLDVTLKGGDGNDNLQHQFQGETDGFLEVVMDGEGGADTVRAYITPATGSTGTVNATVLGGNGDDTLGLHISNPGLAAVHGFIDGGTGFDHASKSLNVADRNCE